MFRTMLVTGLVATALAISGCGTTAKPPVPTSSSSSPAESPSASSSSSPSESPSASAGSAPNCVSDIKVEARPAGAAAGTVVATLVFTNVGTATCSLQGYPGVDLVTGTGAVVTHAARTLRGMVGLPQGVTSPPYVVLAPNQSASAQLEASDVPTGSLTNCGSYTLRITPPETNLTLSGGAAKMPRCGVQIHPVESGIHTPGH